MHLQAGVANGTTLEYQTNSATSYNMLFDNRPEPQDGWITLPDAPGLGVTPNLDAVKEFTQDGRKAGEKRPASNGAHRADQGRGRHEDSPGKARI
jgi:Enolase C-terminal domain-like